MNHDESVEVVESDRQAEPRPRFSSAFRENTARPTSARQFPEGMSDSEDLDVGQEIGSKESESKVNAGIASRQPSSTNGDLRRPTTAGRPGTAGTRSGTSRGGSRSGSTRPRPPSPEPSPSDAAGPPSEEDDDEFDGANAAKVEGVYNPADYDDLKTTPEIKELFEYIKKYSTSATNTGVEVKLKPFIPDYSPSVGDIDAFIKVIHPDVKKDGLGIKVLDEPCAFQSDPSVLDLKLRALAKQNSAKSVLVKKVENVGKNTKIIENWIKDISDLHRSKPSPSVHYSKPMPDIDNLLQEWPREFEELLKSAALPSPSMDCDLKTYVDLICNLLDIPVYKSRVQSLHLLATLYLTHKSFNNFGTLGSSGDGMEPSSASIRGDGVDRLEL